VLTNGVLSEAQRLLSLLPAAALSPTTIGKSRRRACSVENESLPDNLIEPFEHKEQHGQTQKSIHAGTGQCAKNSKHTQQKNRGFHLIWHVISPRYGFPILVPLIPADTTSCRSLAFATPYKADQKPISGS